eukprot:4825881-Pyramimonas_sp.AAC.1
MVISSPLTLKSHPVAVSAPPIMVTLSPSTVKSPPVKVNTPLLMVNSPSMPSSHPSAFSSGSSPVPPAGSREGTATNSIPAAVNPVVVGFAGKSCETDAFTGEFSPRDSASLAESRSQSSGEVASMLAWAVSVG